MVNEGLVFVKIKDRLRWTRRIPSSLRFSSDYTGIVRKNTFYASVTLSFIKINLPSLFIKQKTTPIGVAFCKELTATHHIVVRKFSQYRHRLMVHQVGVRLAIVLHHVRKRQYQFLQLHCAYGASQQLSKHRTLGS